MKMRWPAVILAVFHLWCLSGGVYSPPDGRQVSCRTLPGESRSIWCFISLRRRRGCWN